MDHVHPRSFGFKYFPQDILRQFDPKMEISNYAGWALDNVQIQERKNSSYPGTKTFDIRRPHVSMFLLVEMKHPSTSINAMGVKATNYGAMKRYELFSLRTAANSLISRQFSCRFVLLSVIKAKSTITQM